jgi:Tol biopolymer transport system component
MLCGLMAVPAVARAQYFGQNKVQHRNLEFLVLESEHFDIYYYAEEAEAAARVARMAERWYARLSTVLGVPLTGRQPLVLYASHPEFSQTNVIEGFIGEGTGGVTEGARRRIVLPLAATLADTDHVLGHELVHAFQYDILGRNAGFVPLWLIEGMAEYLSLGTRHPHTAMWLRDAAYANELPDLGDLNDPRYFPYRFGHAFWAYVGGRYGDRIAGAFLTTLSPAGETMDPVHAVELVTGAKQDELVEAWHRSIREIYDIAEGAERPAGPGPAQVVISERTGSGSVNVGPALNPSGRWVAFLSERDRLSIDLYVADAATGKIVHRLTSTATDPHFESLQFLASAGAWSPEGDRLAVATIRGGFPAIAIFRAVDGDLESEIHFKDDLPGLGEIFNPAWSPNGRYLAFAGQAGGQTDLYLHEIETGETRRLTNDAFADLQPTFAPDGDRLAFVTERFSTDLQTLTFRGLDLAILDIAGGSVERVATGLTGNQINPEWSVDGRSLYFVADANGRQDPYQYRLGDRSAVPLTSVGTAVSGITPTSPALSASRTGEHIAITVFRDAGYEIHILPTSSLQPVSVAQRDFAALPPVERQASVVAEQLAASTTGLPSPDTEFDARDYSAGLSLVGIGQQVGVSTGAFGTFLSGGIGLQFSDVLGEHLLGVSAGVNGGLKDAGGGVAYLNRTSRWNWGVFGERAPLRYGAGAVGFVDVDGQRLFVEQTELFRQTYSQGGALVAYPFSRVLRAELSTSATHIGFDREVETLFFDPVTGAFLGRTLEELPAAESLRYGAVSAALVRDTSVFGLTGPIAGQRFRLEVSPTFGDLRLNNVTGDFRHYVMPVTPVTVAGRVLHFGRYGGSSEDERLLPLFLGYDTLVRGYEPGSFEASECTPTPADDCPEFSNLLGSRILVTSLELRAPAVGLFKGRLDYGGVPVDLVAFADAGVAWTSADRPSFAGGSRDWVTSVGFGARVNLFGFAIVEFDIVRPLQRPERGWTFAFAFRPGF